MSPTESTIAAQLRQAVQVVLAHEPCQTSHRGERRPHADPVDFVALAELPETQWTPEIQRTTWERLAEHWAPLEDAGIDYDFLPVPASISPRAGTAKVGRSWVEGSDVLVDTARGKEAIAAMRAIPGARWLGNPALWRVPVRSSTVAQALVEATRRFEMVTSPAFTGELRELGGDRMEEVPSLGVYLAQDGSHILARPAQTGGAWPAFEKVPGATLLKDEGAFRIPMSLVSWTQVAALAQRFGLPMDPELEANARAAFRDALHSYERSTALEPEGTIAEIPGMRDVPGKPLDPAQWAGIEYIVDHHTGVAVWDEQGVAKTAETLASWAVLGHQRMIWICPSSTKEKIQREVMERFPGWDPRIIDGRAAEGGDRVLRSFDPAIPAVAILNAEILKAHTARLLQWNPDCLTVDEAHRFKEASVSWTESAMELSHQVRSAGGSVATLTGTPQPSGPWELVSLLDIMGRLDSLGGKKYVERRYCGGHWASIGKGRRAWQFDKERAKEHALELNRLLRQSCMLRRRLKDVCPDLVCLPAEILSVEPDERVMEDYRSAEADIASYMAERAAALARTMGKDPHSAAVRARLKVRMAEDGIELVVLRRLIGLAKVPGVVAWAKEWLSLNQEVLVPDLDGVDTARVGKLAISGWHNDVVQALHDGLGGVAIRGKDPRKARDRARHAFQEDPEVRLIVCSIGAAGEGIELTAGSTSGTVEFDWVPKTHQQFVSRQYRRGQTGPVRPVYFKVPGTTDDVQVHILDEKYGGSAQTIDGERSKVKMFGEAEMEAEVFDWLIDRGASAVA